MSAQTFPVQIMAKSYGNWALGFAWVDVSIGGATTTGLAIYCRHSVKEPSRRVVGSIKEAMIFLQKCRVPARAAGKFLAEVEAQDTARFLGFEPQPS